MTNNPTIGGVSLKDHEFREVVNHIRDIAIKYRDAGQLRERISQELAALQSTIAQLQAQLVAQKENLESAVNNSIMFADKADELQVRIAALKGERG